MTLRHMHFRYADAPYVAAIAHAECSITEDDRRYAAAMSRWHMSLRESCDSYLFLSTAPFAAGRLSGAVSFDKIRCPAPLIFDAAFAA